MGVTGACEGGLTINHQIRNLLNWTSFNQYGRSARGGVRTLDQLVKSQLLYH